MEKEHPLKIGLEIHGYLDTAEKLFCKCSTNSEEEQNSNICPICTGTPGSKPMLPNEEAMKKLIQLSLILKCKIETKEPLSFQRKHYNWPDLPKGYQNTISGAHCKFPASEGEFKGIKIWECHLEEDPAAWNPETGHTNYNRSGLPLVEVVTAPDFKTVEEVIFWLKSFIHSASYIKVLRKNAGIKVDVNVSTYGSRVEIKNLNSLIKIENALKYEISRQLEANKKKEEIIQETRRYDETSGKTIRMRSKENMDDYRFIADPDLPNINIKEKWVKQIEKTLPETPDQKLEKLLGKFKLEKSDANILAKNLELVEFLEELANEGIDVKKNISWLTVELLRVLNYNKMTLDDAEVNVQPKHLAELIKTVEGGKITKLKAKQIMNDFLPESFSISEQKNISKIEDNLIKNFCEKVILENEKAVLDYKSGSENALNYLIGQVMKLSERRADFQTTKEELKKLLEVEE